MERKGGWRKYDARRGGKEGRKRKGGKCKMRGWKGRRGRRREKWRKD